MCQHSDLKPFDSLSAKKETLLIHFCSMSVIVNPHLTDQKRKNPLSRMNYRVDVVMGSCVPPTIDIHSVKQGNVIVAWEKQGERARDDE